MKAVVRITPSSYEVGDAITIVPDDHIFGGKDLIPGQREVQDVGELSDNDRSKMLMQDEGAVNIAAVSKLPTFQSVSTSQASMKALRRRKYHFDASVKLKDNAQER